MRSAPERNAAIASDSADPWHLPVGVRLSADALVALQAESSQHVAFSLTEACPLRCRHCIVDTTSVGDRGRYMPLAVAEEYARQLPDLHARGVRLVSFTGGEPLLAPKQLRVLSAAAASAGMRCTVVTAAHWATSAAAARRVIAAFPAIDAWHVSTDVFHLEFVAVSRIGHALHAARAAGRQVLVRMAVATPVTGEHRELCEALATALPLDTPVAVQPITRMGRGADIATEVAEAETPAWPCIPNGMVVRYDGTVAPCCAGLVDERERHPFQYARATESGLVAAHQSWCADPLLQLIRAVGFSPVLGWLREEFPQHALATRSPRHPCECCTTLWRDREVVTALRRRANQPENVAKVAAVVEQVFGETYMRAGPSVAYSGAALAPPREVMS